MENKEDIVITDELLKAATSWLIDMSKNSLNLKNLNSFSKWTIQDLVCEYLEYIK